MFLCRYLPPFEAVACRTGFVKRASQLTGTILLALVTCGTWSKLPLGINPGGFTLTPHKVGGV